MIRLAVFSLLLVAPAVFAQERELPYVPVETPNGATLEWRMEGGVKVFHLVLEEIEWEFAEGMKARCWGFNGRTPGPTIEAVEGDRVRILVTNDLPEKTSIHWHGILLPNGMDGITGLTQPGIPPGETWVYEFTLRQHGTQMYHSHGDEMVQIGLGAMGFFVIHPREPEEPRVERDFCIFLAEWHVPAGSARPDPSVMTDFNLFTFNGRAFPGTAPMVVRTGQRVRIRLGNVGQDSHPIHLHGHTFTVVGTDGGSIPPAARWPETTVLVAPGQTRTIEFVADNPGDWPFHCHRRHHTMNAMGHEIPNPIGVRAGDLEARIRTILPGFMMMGQEGMGGMAEMDMPGPENTLKMMGGPGPFGAIEMGGMFTVVKIRDALESYEDPGWYDHPPGTVAHPAPEFRRPEREGEREPGHQHHDR